MNKGTQKQALAPVGGQEGNPKRARGSRRYCYEGERGLIYSISIDDLLTGKTGSVSGNGPVAKSLDDLKKNFLGRFEKVSK